MNAVRSLKQDLVSFDSLMQILQASAARGIGAIELEYALITLEANNELVFDHKTRIYSVLFFVAWTGLLKLERNLF